MLPKSDLIQLRQKANTWAQALGFAQLGVTDIDLSAEQTRFEQWLDKGYNGDMTWLAEHRELRLHPQVLQREACRVISVRLNYLPQNTDQIKILKSADKAYISRYALGRDYHKLMRKRLAQLAKKLEQWVTDKQNALALTADDVILQRPFVDSAPVLERPLAHKAGLGWIGKHTLLINKHQGSWFFLGEILTNIPLPIEPTTPQNHCGDCTACLKICPTDAFPTPYTLDARRCISYLTIENKGAIPEEFREVIGNRVFGCDDCQAICPWNKYAKSTDEQDFMPRHGLASAQLLDLFCWSEEQFLHATEGSAIRRIGHERWQRNLAVGLGNAPHDPAIVQALENRLASASPLVAEHILWALAQQQGPTRRRKRKIKQPKPHEASD